MRPALDCVPAREPDDVDVSDPEADPLRDVVMSCLEIAAPLVDPNDEAEPTWVEERDAAGPELLALTEALGRVYDRERSQLVAEHVSVLAELVHHHRVASDTPLVATGMPDALCALCVVDPESHAASLAARAPGK